ncbi:hypothetical protein McpSp1_05390 [Methanocorpusculaceae archaeon Sp1]|uniref:Uncharacterized protein n=1 Tax=Methanorbis furvi TaxID=3028299 RepID=A0AAE4MDT7_9EURY|nr:hypothetical protein [Methanocorpusculaceae archaeon Sp1]MDV0442230.1 hypothetical protein [Methanocorpusculaceae archaeon Ag1]
MPLNFVPTSVVKGAKRVFTVPITNATAFDANIAALKSEENPLGAAAYQTSGQTVDGVFVSKEVYKATIAYLNSLGKVEGSIVLTAPTRQAYDAIIASLLENDTLTGLFGENMIVDHDAAKDSWSVRVRVHDPTGENYQLDFNRKELKISSYEADAILAKVEEWADTITTLN